MAIFGIGTDLVQVNRIRKIYNKYNTQFARRILTPDELVLFTKSKFDISFFAKRFAAKEAFVKALGTGFSFGISFLDISILNNTHGQPYFLITGKAEFWVKKLGINNYHVSLSDEKEYCLAFVLMEKN